MKESKTTLLISSVSALVAVISLCFTIFVYFKTEQKLTIYERPILKVYGNEIVKKNIDGKTKKISYDFNYTIKNIGKHPADDLVIKTEYILENTEKYLARTVKSVNRINLGDELTVLNSVSPTHEISDKNRVFIKSNISYVDAILKSKRHIENYWYSFDGGKYISHSTFEQKEKVEKILGTSKQKSL